MPKKVSRDERNINYSKLGRPRKKIPPIKRKNDATKEGRIIRRQNKKSVEDILEGGSCLYGPGIDDSITIGSKKKPLPVPTRFQPPRTVKRYTATGMEEIEELRRQNAEQAVTIATMNMRMETLQAQLQALIEERRNDQDALHEARNREQEIENARQLAEAERVAAENDRRRLQEELEQNNIEKENARRTHIAEVHNQVNEAHDRDGLVLEYRNDDHGLRLGGQEDVAEVHEASHARRAP
ncbi:unnamed protein product [Trichogramma brassicae]|uniref:Uncharacterized protein n=1 Tax=Trichogramma brassicae TaxID=86971 RepID=A0A6H5IY37_9HYME|nr:unnamed protein product [Trichogramma brassicae]